MFIHRPIWAPGILGLRSIGPRSHSLRPRYCLARVGRCPHIVRPPVIQATMHSPACSEGGSSTLSMWRPCKVGLLAMQGVASDPIRRWLLVLGKIAKHNPRFVSACGGHGCACTVITSHRNTCRRPFVPTALLRSCENLGSSKACARQGARSACAVASIVRRFSDGVGSSTLSMWQPCKVG